MTQSSITCPVCGMTSYNPTDMEMGYCGNCHGYTSPVNVLERAKRFLREAERDEQDEEDAIEAAYRAQGITGLGER